nr:hypothetical protein MarQu_355 [Marseillevirus sp.]
MSTQESIQNLLCELPLHECFETDTPLPTPPPFLLPMPSKSFYDASPSWAGIRDMWNDYPRASFSAPTRYVEELERMPGPERLKGFSLPEGSKEIFLPVRKHEKEKNLSKEYQGKPFVEFDSTNPREQLEWEQKHGETLDKEFWKSVAKLWDEID